jgi:divalent metal cation (Fe/Co/Zn/Cd) transporter
MATAAQISAGDLAQRARRLQLLTIIWMVGEAIIALAAAWRARSPALLGFGGDSAIELLSAVIVFWRFRTKSEAESIRAEKIAARIAGLLLFSVAGFVLLISALALSGYNEPRPSILGIIVLIAAAVGMPVLASQKRKLAAQLSSPSLNADAAQSSLCGYLSWIALAGIVTNAFLHVPWADSFAALILVPFVAREGWTTIRAARLGCHC